MLQEKRLQEEMDSEQNTTESVSTINRALHSIAAHLHRYRSELNSVEGIIAGLSTHYTILCERGAEGDAGKASRGFSQVLTQMQATNYFTQELEKKVQNILALVSKTDASFCLPLTYTFAALQPYPDNQRPTACQQREGDAGDFARDARGCTHVTPDGGRVAKVGRGNEER